MASTFQVYRVLKKNDIYTRWRFLVNGKIKMTGKEPFVVYGANRACRNIIGQFAKYGVDAYKGIVRKRRDGRHYWVWMTRGKLVAMSSNTYKNEVLAKAEMNWLKKLIVDFGDSIPILTASTTRNMKEFK